MTDVPGGSSNNISGTDVWRDHDIAMVDHDGDDLNDTPMNDNDGSNRHVRPRNDGETQRPSKILVVQHTDVEIHMERTQEARAKAKLLEKEKHALQLANRSLQQQMIALLQAQAKRDKDVEDLKAHVNSEFRNQVDAQVDARLVNHDNLAKKALADREAELLAQKAQEAEKHRLELERREATYETDMAALHARFSTQRPGQRPQNDETEFPDGPLTRTPEFISGKTREARRIEAIIRDGPDRFMNVTMTPPTQPGPSAVPQTPQQSTSSAAQGIDMDDPRVLERVKKMIVEEMANSKAAEKKPSSRRYRKGMTTKLIQARQEQQDLLSPRQDLRWKSITREHWRLNTGYNRARDFYNYSGVSGEAARACENGEVPSSDKFFFGKGWRTSVVNNNILEKYIQQVLEKRAKDPGQYDVPDVHHDYLLALFHNYLKDAQATWQSHQPRLGESDGEGHQRGQDCIAERLQRNKGTTRKRNKFFGRDDVTERMMKIALAKKDNTSAAIWKWLKEDLLPKLGPAGMSSEEDEVVEAQFGTETRLMTAHQVSLHPWRAEKVNGYAKLIDKSAEHCKRKDSGRRVRIPGKKQSETAPPLGLPRSLYDEVWLAEQRAFIPNIEEELEISEEEFELMDITEV